MTGQTISSRPPLPLFALLLACAGAVPVVAAVARQDVRFAVDSLPLWAVAAALFLTRSRPTSVTFTETALEVAEPPQAVAYEEVEGLLAGGRLADPFKKGARRFPIQVIHANGVVEIPAGLDVPSDEVYRFLLRQIPGRSSRPVHKELDGYLRQKRKAFGAEEVWSFAARVGVGRSVIGRKGRAVCGALFLSGLGIIAYGAAAGAGPPRVVPGIFLSVLSAIIGAMFWAAGRQYSARVKGGRASLVIAPDGMAVLHGDLRGELRWEELLDVKLNPTARSVQFGSVHFGGEQVVGGIVLKVAGATIVLTDVFDRPLPLVYQQLCHVWRADAGAGDSAPPAPRPAPPRPAADPGGITAGDE